MDNSREYRSRRQGGKVCPCREISLICRSRLFKTEGLLRGRRGNNEIDIRK